MFNKNEKNEKLKDVSIKMIETLDFKMLQLK